MREIILDSRKLEEKEAAQEYLKRQFCFPDYYGKNLDAFFDCLAEISSETQVIVNVGEKTGEYLKKILRVLEVAAEENKKICVKLCEIDGE